MKGYISIGLCVVYAAYSMDSLSPKKVRFADDDEEIVEKPRNFIKLSPKQHKKCTTEHSKEITSNIINRYSFQQFDKFTHFTEIIDKAELEPLDLMKMVDTCLKDYATFFGRYHPDVQDVYKHKPDLLRAVFSSYPKNIKLFVEECIKLERNDEDKFLEFIDKLD